MMAGGKLLILRLNRLGHVPPGWNSAEILQENGMPVLVFEYCADSTGLSDIPGPFPRVRLGAPRWLGWVPRKTRPLFLWLATFVFLANTLRKQRPQCIVAHGIQEQAMAWALHRLLGVPYVVHVHEVFERREVHGFSRWLLQLEGPALRGARFLIFPERNRAQLYQERYSLKNRIHVVYNCPRLSQPQSVHPRNLRLEQSIPTDHLIVGYMGGIGEANAILELVKALSLTPKVTLMLWGWANRSYLEEIQSTAQSLGLGSRVRIAGQVEDKWGHLAGCDVLYCVYRDHLLRTRFQATASNKFTEALGCGVPVLVLKAGGFEQAIAETHAGIAVSDLAASTLARALDQLSNAALRGSLGAGARKAFAHEYNYDRQFAPVLEAFTHLVTPPNPLKIPVKNASIAR